MTKILCLETSTEVCSVALVEDGQVIDFIEDKDGMNHSRLLTGFIEQLLQRNLLVAKNIDAVAVSMGPGSYTGLRIGVSAAKGLCFALDVPLIAVCPLQAMSAGLLQQGLPSGFTPLASDRLMPMIDARRMEVFTAVFDNCLEPLSAVEAKVVDEQSFADLLEQGRCFFFGNGANKCKQTITHEHAVFVDGIYASARQMAQLAHNKFVHQMFVDVAYFEPFYLKDFVATTPKNTVF